MLISIKYFQKNCIFLLFDNNRMDFFHKEIGDVKIDKEVEVC